MEHSPFPFDRDEEVPIPDDDLLNHPALQKLEREVDTEHTCGYFTLLRTGRGREGGREGGRTDRGERWGESGREEMKKEKEGGGEEMNGRRR